MIKYKTLYPKDAKVKIPVDLWHFIWLKDKDRKCFLHSEMNTSKPINLMDRYFWIGENEVFLRPYPDENYPKRILIKYKTEVVAEMEDAKNRK